MLAEFIVAESQTQEEHQLSEVIDRLVTDLNRLTSNRQQWGNQNAWHIAHRYVRGVAEARALQSSLTSTKINQLIRSRQDYSGWGSTALANAIKIDELWPDFIEKVIAGNNFSLAYEAVRHIANCKLNQEVKDRLLAWVQECPVKREDLRARIAQEQEAERGVQRPDFPIQVSNYWRFHQWLGDDGFDGGIHPYVVANLLYYFTDAGDVVIDPMAGGDTTYRVVEQYRFFGEAYEGEFGGPRTVLRSDIEPRFREIERADVTKGLPWPANCADFCLLDPPYYGIANGKYPTFGRTIEEWETNIQLAVLNISRVLKPGGYIAVIVDDYLRSAEFQPTSHLVFGLLSEMGLRAAGTIYDTHPNYLSSMNALGMWRAKRARLLVNGMKIIHVFEKT